MQETFFRLLVARQDGALIQDVRAWLFRVARNQWIDSRRERQRYWTDPSADALPSGNYRDGRPNPEQELMRGEQTRRISEEISLLPELQRECLRLRAQGLRYYEIAATLGIAMTAAVDHVRHALARLRRTFRVSR